jgi:integrase
MVLPVGKVMAKLTKRVIEGLAAGPSDRVVWDDDLPGYGVRVLPNGAKSYLVQYRTTGGRAGRSRRLTLGKVGVGTPDENRARAREILAAVERGADPVADRHAQRTIPTVAQLVERYLSEGPADKPNKKISSWRTDASNLHSHIVPLLGTRRADTLSKRDFQQLYASVSRGDTGAPDRASGKARGRVRIRGGEGTAWRATVVASAMFSWAVGRGLLASNPAVKVQLKKPKGRERFLLDGEVARLGDALIAAEQAGANPRALAIIRVLLLSGARRNEIESLKPEYLDFQRSAAFLPNSKTGAKTLPLGAAALEVLAANIKPGAAWVFPAGRGEGYFRGIGKVWRQVSTLAGLPGVRIHDLRHSFASCAVAGSSSLFLLGKILGHTKTETTERYAHLQLDPVRAVADQASRRLADALDGNRPANVVKLHSA